MAQAPVKKIIKGTGLSNPPRAKKKNILLVSALFGIIGAGLLISTFAAPATQTSITVTQAASQPTAIGKNIYALEAWNGKIYAGYGDYSANSGPISIMAYDPLTKQLTQEATAQTDAIYIYRKLSGKLFAPAIDNKGADVAFATSPGQWQNITGAGSTHAFDIAELGGKLWMSGSIGKTATIWSSADGGLTWQISLSVPAERVDSVARFYFIGTYKGKLYTQATDGAYPHSTAYSFDPSTQVWAKAPSITITNDFFNWGRKPVEFGNYMLLLTREVISGPGSLIKYDGTARTTANQYSSTVLSSVYDITVDGGYIYALNYSGTVVRSTDLASWQTVATGPKMSKSQGSGRSIAVLNGKVYIGTYDSKIVELPISTSTRR